MSKLNKKKLERKLKKYIKHDKLENAVKTANKLSKMYPDEAEYILTKANCLESLEKYDEAAKEYKNSLKISDRTVDDYIDVYFKLDYMDKYDDALDVINEGLKSFPNTEPLVLGKAITLVNSDRTDDAVKYIDGFSKTDENWKKLLFIKADIEMELGNFEKAIETCDEILEEGKNISAMSKKLSIIVEMGSMDEVEGFINPLLEDEYYKSWATSTLSMIYDEKGETDKAMSMLDDFIKENPEDMEIKKSKGLLLLSNENLEEAEECLRNSFEYEKDNPESENEINISIATLFYASGNIERALELAESIPKDSDSYKLSLILQNQIYDELNRYNDFESDDDDIGDYFKTDPRMFLEREMYSEDDSGVYELINEAWAEDNPRKQKKLAKKAIKLDKYAIDAYNILAYNTKNPNQKLEYYKEAIDLFKETHDEEYFEKIKGHFYGVVETRPFMRAMQGYADGLYLLGKEKEAADMYEYMLELNPGDNQGVRYPYISVLLLLNRLDDVTNVFDEYDHEKSTQFLFSKLLLAIKSEHDEKIIEKLYQEAIESNEHVVPFLLGKKQLPKKIPSYYSLGDPYEAIEYIHESLKPWIQDKKAYETLEYLDVKIGRKNNQ